MMKRLLPLFLLALVIASSRAEAAGLQLENATIADLQTAFASGTLTSEKVTKLYLARIQAYDKKGPAINAVITLNPHALEEAQALDAERKAGKVRGPLHGVPIVLKDNYNMFDLPTTAGSQLLAGSIPAEDATVVKKLRAAGVVILAKVNLNEFASSGGNVSGATDPAVLKAGQVPVGYSTMGGQTRNPHDLTRVPSSSSGGTGASIAAAFAQFGTGTDTGGSIRGPASANGVAGLKPTWGLVSRAGIVPLALSLDTAGPIARNVYDVAAALSVMVGVDPADEATLASEGKFKSDYTAYLRVGSLKGARIGIARDFFGKDADVSRVMAAAIKTLKSRGAVLIDPVKIPEYLLHAQGSVYDLLVASEFKAQITTYLQTLKGNYPKSFDEIVAKANAPATHYRSPQKAYALKYTADEALSLDDPSYLVLKNQMLPTMRAGMAAIFQKYQLDAIIYPTSARPAPLIVPPDAKPPAGGESATRLGNETGLPDLIVPAGMTKTGLPVTISFLGEPWSEPKLLSYGYDFEQATHARVLPKFTPVLAGEKLP